MVQTTQHCVTKRPSGQTLFRECKGALTRSVALACAKDSSLALDGLDHGQSGPADKAALWAKDCCATLRDHTQLTHHSRRAATASTHTRAEPHLQVSG